MNKNKQIKTITKKEIKKILRKLHTLFVEKSDLKNNLNTLFKTSFKDINETHFLLSGEFVTEFILIELKKMREENFYNNFRTKDIDIFIYSYQGNNLIYDFNSSSTNELLATKQVEAIYNTNYNRYSYHVKNSIKLNNYLTFNELKNNFFGKDFEEKTYFTQFKNLLLNFTTVEENKYMQYLYKNTKNRYKKAAYNIIKSFDTNAVQVGIDFTLENNNTNFIISNEFINFLNNQFVVVGKYHNLFTPYRILNKYYSYNLLNKIKPIKPQQNEQLKEKQLNQKRYLVDKNYYQLYFYYMSLLNKSKYKMYYPISLLEMILNYLPNKNLNNKDFNSLIKIKKINNTHYFYIKDFSFIKNKPFLNNFISNKEIIENIFEKNIGVNFYTEKLHQYIHLLVTSQIISYKKTKDTYLFLKNKNIKDFDKIKFLIEINKDKNILNLDKNKLLFYFKNMVEHSEFKALSNLEFDKVKFINFIFDLYNKYLFLLKENKEFASTLNKEYFFSLIKNLFPLYEYKLNIRKIRTHIKKESEKLITPLHNFKLLSLKDINYNVIIKEINTIFNLKKEGKKMNNCVGGYGSKIENLGCFIFNLDINNNYYTLELIPTFNPIDEHIYFRINQFLGKNNQKPNEKDFLTGIKFIKEKLIPLLKNDKKRLKAIINKFKGIKND